MRILYHHRTQADDAQGVHIYEMIRAFKELGHEVDLFALVRRDETGEEKIYGGYWTPIANLTPQWAYELLSLAYNVYGYFCLRRATLHRRPDLIYERYALNTVCGIWISKRYGIPLLLEVNAPLCYEQSRLGQLVFKRFAQRLERWICSNSTRTIVVSDVMKEFLARSGVPEDNITVVPNGIDPQKFHPEISGDAVRRKYGLQNKPVIGFVGWFRKWHGLEMLLDVMREPEFVQRDVRLLLVGDGPAYADLYRFAADHQMLSRVVFAGPVARDWIPEHIAAMDIAVQPSVTEYACPIKIIEYMGMGRCIVAPDQPNIRELLRDGIDSVLFEPGSRCGLGSALLKALNSAEGNNRFGRRAYEALRQHKYLWSANADRAVKLVKGRDSSYAAA